MEESPRFPEYVREVAPAALRAKAGFAKTHTRPVVIITGLGEDDEDLELSDSSATDADLQASE